MARSHNLGFPRIGAHRELKFALEAYWRGECDQAALQQTAATLRQQHWQWQQQAGLDVVPVGDFALYDHILQWSQTLGVVPVRFRGIDDPLTQLFAMARGRQQHQHEDCGCGAVHQHGAALEMTKWFDTNYHYLVPEFEHDQTFTLGASPLLAQVAEAKQQGVKALPVIVGPVTYLWLGRSVSGQDKLALLPALLAAYQHLLAQLHEQGCEWLQIDEPILSLELSPVWQAALTQSYQSLAQQPVQLLVTNYFGELGDNLAVATALPVAGLHIDAVRAPHELAQIDALWPDHKVLSVGVIDGRNIWRTDLSEWVAPLSAIEQRRGEQLWLAPSCSLLHVPVDLANEQGLDEQLKSWLAFARQKLQEVATLTRLVNGTAHQADHALLAAGERARRERANTTRVNNPVVRQRVAQIKPADSQRAQPFAERYGQQQAHLQLPLLPTTTIGSFPQTPAIRQHRAAFKRGELSATDYEHFLKSEIARVIHKQQLLGLDVLVHGEPERNDMVEYFGEWLDGAAVSQSGWVQSYGSRCVKPPIIYGDIARSQPITVRWSEYAQSLTERPVKGMLTGPVTILCWSFVRDDLPRQTVCEQIAWALRDEVIDLEQAGLGIIQIDEPALREGLPLRKSHQPTYLDWAVRAFRLAASGVQPHTQIHTHMCYCDFDDILPAIAAMDADVLSIETARSGMTLLSAFEHFAYPNAIGPGVYDIHSPQVPAQTAICELISRASEQLPVERLWVNPDCGLKTRGWAETEASLKNLVAATRQARQLLL